MGHVDDQGTVATGYIQTPWGRLNYREVDWPEKKEIAACIRANRSAGEFDFGKVQDLLVTLDDGAFDISLTGFESVDIEKMVEWEKPEVECPKCGKKFSTERK